MERRGVNGNESESSALDRTLLEVRSKYLSSEHCTSALDRMLLEVSGIDITPNTCEETVQAMHRACNREKENSLSGRDNAMRSHCTGAMTCLQPRELIAFSARGTSRLDCTSLLNACILLLGLLKLNPQHPVLLMENESW